MKFYLIQTTPSNYVDYLVLLLFIVFLALPFYYINKALPNKILIKSIKEIKSTNNAIVLKYSTNDWKLPVTTKFRKKFLDKETEEALLKLK
jgi:predicted Co/Zn/Cd cation transporter (cation efflux family)